MLTYITTPPTGQILILDTLTKQNNTDELHAQSVLMQPKASHPRGPSDVSKQQAQATPLHQATACGLIRLCK